MYHIVPQEYKETQVDCKVVSFFPIEDSDGNVKGFGKLKTQYARVLFSHDNPLHKGTFWKLTMALSTGMMNLTPPARLQSATLTTPAKLVPATYSGSKLSSGLMSPESMLHELTVVNKIPLEFAKRIMGLIADTASEQMKKAA